MTAKVMQGWDGKGGVERLKLAREASAKIFSGVGLIPNAKMLRHYGILSGLKILVCSGLCSVRFASTD